MRILGCSKLAILIFDVGNNDIGEGGVNVLAENLKFIPKLRILNLSKNKYLYI